MKQRVSMLVLLLVCAVMTAQAAGKRKVILDQDAMGPGGSNMLSMLLAIESKDVDVLGITVESGDGWQAENVAHTLRMLELIGRTDIPVYRGATNPLLNSLEKTKRWEAMHGKLQYKGAWMQEWPEYAKAPRDPWHGADVVPVMKEGEPHTKPADGTAAEFLVHEVRKYPGEVSIVALGPVTNIALAAKLDEQFAAQAKDFVWMGAALNPQPPSRDEYSLQFLFSPRSNFNVRWDPEAASIVMEAGWKHLLIVPTDATIEPKFGEQLLGPLRKSKSLAAKYIVAYPVMGLPMWDEVTVALWLDPTLSKHTERVSMDFNTEGSSANYGDTLTWRPGKGPGLGEPVVDVVRAVDVARFEKMFAGAME
ncbi:MAG: nucleoside hydrolase [Acidobacteriaceae bacterium]|nr:nucleoside hydrolase [Acidobacteriaceae bacterium]